jgi:hypothetical protein
MFTFLWRSTKANQKEYRKQQQMEESVTDAGALNTVMDRLLLAITVENGSINNDHGKFINLAL